MDSGDCCPWLRSININMLDSAFALLNTLTFWKSFFYPAGDLYFCSVETTEIQVTLKKWNEWKWCNHEGAGVEKPQLESSSGKERNNDDLRFLVSVNMLEHLIQSASISMRQSRGKCTIDSHNVFPTLRFQQALLAVCLSFKFNHPTGNTYVVHCN